MRGIVDCLLLVSVLSLHTLALPQSFGAESRAGDTLTTTTGFAREARALPPPPYNLVYHVPNTRTIVYAKIETQPIDVKVIGGTIQLAQNAVKEMIRTSGDGWLPDTLDPYIVDGDLGCYVYAESDGKMPPPGKRRQHLTWGILSSALTGLYRFSITYGYAQEMHWSVLDSRWGIVGVGYIKAGSKYLQVANAGGREVNSTVDITS
ncbi:MAG: hypothetical protein Q9181_007105 [Wetmoreana brouardii]